MQSPLEEAAEAMAGQSVRVLVWDRDLVDMWCLDQDGARVPFRGKGSRWHVHPELELTVITRGAGVLCVGDHIGRFTAPDCILLGCRVPHVWKSQGAMAGVSLQFGAAPAALAALPELASLARLWRRAAFGVRWHGETAAWLRDEMLRLEGLGSLPRLARLLAMLEVMRTAPGRHRRQLSERVLIHEDRHHRKDGRHHHPDDGMRRVVDHLIGHFRDELRLDDLVRMSGRSQATFCRRFSALTGRTFTAYLNAIRIQEVRRALLESRRSVTDIAFGAGFNNLSHFHAVFRAATGCTPLAFRKLAQA